METGWNDIPGLIMMGLVGSRAHQLATPDSDEDWRGIFVAPVRDFLSLATPYNEMQIPGHPSHDSVAWEVGKFLRLALKGNPSILELLWAPTIWNSSDPLYISFARTLIINRGRLLSTACHRTFYGYARGEAMKGLRKGDFKRCAHSLRMMYMGIHLMQIGELLIVLPFSERKVITQAREGMWNLIKLGAMLDDLDAQFLEIEKTSVLPAQADYDFFDQLLYDFRSELAAREWCD